MKNNSLNKDNLLNGMKLNQVSNYEVNDQARYLNRTERNVKNLSPWISKVKANMYSSPEINK